MTIARMVMLNFAKWGPLEIGANIAACTLGTLDEVLRGENTPPFQVRTLSPAGEIYAWRDRLRDPGASMTTCRRNPVHLGQCDGAGAAGIDKIDLFARTRPHVMSLPYSNTDE